MGGTEDLRPLPHADRLAAVRSAFGARFGRPPDLVAEAPGRVNLIGEHVDYNQGIVLPVAIDRSVFAAAAIRDDDTVVVHSIDYRADATFSLSAAITPDPAQPWSNYVRGVFSAFPGASRRGLDIAVTGDVPQGAGLSSSAALEVATAGAVNAAWETDLPPEELAIVAWRAENEFVGVRCGIMDQYAAALGTWDCALLIDCRSRAVQTVPLRFAERGIAIVVLDSGIPRRLEHSAYNQRRHECDEAARLLGRPLRDLSLPEVEAAQLPDGLRRRARHVVTEIERVEQAVAALRAGEIERLGMLMAGSHRSLRDDFEVSTPELDLLVELATQDPSVIGTRMTGAGFGGCTVNLVREESVDAFVDHVLGRYRRETRLAAKAHVCRASDGLRVW